jgi:1-acyl-sn-glycerol-3-phosphate acyltransferase
MQPGQLAGLLAVMAAVAAVAGVLAWVFIHYKKTGLTPGQYFLYWFNFALSRLLWRAEISGPLPIAPKQGAVIICNHTSSVDTCLIQLAAGPRVVHWMVAKEYFSMPVFGYLLRLVRCNPVGRAGVDTAATKLAIRQARSGELVGMFPEGRINTSGNLLLPGRPGAAMVALKARVPVIPCYVSGLPYGGTVTSSLTMPAHAKLVVGEPIDLSPYYDRQKEDGVLQELTKRFLGEIARLAGREDFTPELAGRRWKHDISTEAAAVSAQ